MRQDRPGRAPFGISQDIWDAKRTASRIASEHGHDLAWFIPNTQPSHGGLDTKMTATCKDCDAHATLRVDRTGCADDPLEISLGELLTTACKAIQARRKKGR